MDTISFTDFVDQAVKMIAALGDEAADMDGRAAFLLGMVTWFLVEQAVRRLAGVLRWAIIAAALAGSGIAVASLLDFADRATMPPGPDARQSPVEVPAQPG